MNSKQDNDSTRKTPTQQRSRQTIETILEATAQILEEDGGERLTTNRLADRAGYSIGTIYQYFPNREAILLALIERQRKDVQRRIDRVLKMHQDHPWQDKIKAILGLLHQAFARHRKVPRRLVRALVAFSFEHGLPEPSEHFAQAIVAIWRETEMGHELHLNEAESFVLSRSVIEVLRSATLMSSPLLGNDALEDALYRLVIGFLNAPTTPARVISAER